MMNMYKLLDICDFQGGTQPPKEEWIDIPKEGYIRMLQIRDYSQGDEKFIQYVKDTKKLHKCQEDDIMLSRYGYIGQAFTGLAGAYNVALVKVVKKRAIDTRYLLYYFQSEYFQRSLLSNVGSRATIPGFNKTELKTTEIPVPSADEQHRIGEKLAKVDLLIERHRQQIVLLEQLVKSRFIELFGDPLHPTHSKPLGDVAVLERGRFSPRPRNDPRYYGGDYPFIQTGDIANCGHRLSTYRQTLNEKGIHVSKKFPVGTIVIAIVGATIGATAILEIEVYAPDSVIGISVDTKQYNAVFMETLLQFWQPELLRIAPESARANINLGILQNIPIIDAELQLQEQFAAFVEQTDKSKYYSFLSYQSCLQAAQFYRQEWMSCLTLHS